MSGRGAGGPLAGIRILDLTRLFPFAYGTQLLVDLGAEVIKVEQPGGEVGRDYPAQYLATNRGKRSITLDLRRTEGRHLLLDLVATADVVVESFRPGYLAKLGLGPEELRAVRSDLVICSVSGYGPDGDLADVPGHDLNYYVMSGAAWPDSTTDPVIPAIPVVDMAIGHHLAAAVSAALVGAARTGAGGHIELSMTDLALALNTSAIAFAVASGEQAVPFPAFVLGEVPCYRVWRTADGRWIALGNLEPKFWLELLQVIDRVDLADDALATGARGQEVIAELAEIFAARTAAAWTSAFAGREVCFAPVLNPQEALEHQEFDGRGAVRILGDGVEVLFPGTIDGVRPPRSEVLAAPGADNQALLAGLGIDPGGAADPPAVDLP